MLREKVKHKVQGLLSDAWVVVNGGNPWDLSSTEIGQSNLILINRVTLECILPQTEVSTSPCCSSSELIGKTTSCRTIVRVGQVHEATQYLVREAICSVALYCS